jgi:hypothetical protein
VAYERHLRSISIWISAALRWPAWPKSADNGYALFQSRRGAFATCSRRSGLLELGRSRAPTRDLSMFYDHFIAALASTESRAGACRNFEEPSV